MPLVCRPQIFRAPARGKQAGSVTVNTPFEEACATVDAGPHLLEPGVVAGYAVMLDQRMDALALGVPFRFAASNVDIAGQADDWNELPVGRLKAGECLEESPGLAQIAIPMQGLQH